MNPADLPYVNGTAPRPGAECTGFRLLQQQVDGRIADPAHSAYFRLDGDWVHLCFDGGTIFWREAQAPGAPVNAWMSPALVLVDLDELVGVVGSVLRDIHHWESPTEVGARLRFASGTELAFTHLSDRDETLVVASTPAEPDDSPTSFLGPR